MEQYLIFYQTILGDGYIWNGKVLQYLYLLEPITYCSGSALLLKFCLLVLNSCSSFLVPN